MTTKPSGVATYAYVQMKKVKSSRRNHVFCSFVMVSPFSPRSRGRTGIFVTDGKIDVWEVDTHMEKEPERRYRRKKNQMNTGNKRYKQFENNTKIIMKHSGKSYPEEHIHNGIPVKELMSTRIRN